MPNLSIARKWAGGSGPGRSHAPAPPSFAPLRSGKLLDQLCERIRCLHYSRRTEEAYVHWCKEFIRFHRLKHPRDLGGPEVEAFLSWLVSERNVAPATHRQALSALLFLYGKVLGQDLPWMSDIGRPRTTPRVPVVLTKEELTRVFQLMDGEHWLFAQLLYGTGMRLSEGLQLRVKDVDFDHQAIIVREGKGRKDFGTRSGLTCCKQVMTFVPCRSSSDTRTWRRR
jgi:integrase